MKKTLTLLLLLVSAPLFAGAPESDLSTIVQGQWSISMSDLIIFGKKGIEIQPDPMHRAEIHIAAGHTGTIRTANGPMTFTWKTSMSRLMITTPKMTLQFKIRSLNENQVMAIQEKASEPNIAFVGILQRVISSEPDAGAKSETAK